MESEKRNSAKKTFDVFIRWQKKLKGMYIQMNLYNNTMPRSE